MHIFILEFYIGEMGTRVLAESLQHPNVVITQLNLEGMSVGLV